MLTTILGLGATALELGLISSITVLALFLSYSMLNVCDLSTDGCFTLGAAVGAVVAISGHPYLSILAALCVGMVSGFITALLQTKMGIDSLLSGIIVNTGLYSVNIAIMGGASLLNLNKTETVFTKARTLLAGTFLSSQYRLAVVILFVALALALMTWFLKTRLGLAIRATGNNPDMVKSSSINPAFTTIVGLCLSNSLTALSGCLLAQSQKSVNVTIGSGMVTIALASLLIGRAFMGKGSIGKRAVGAVLGAFVFRLVYTIALRFNLPAYMLKLVSSVIVIIAIAGPYFKKRFPEFKRVHDASKGGGNA
ncbi:MAG: ABC transporter permease [Spirochaetales bacterium]|nr:ABC transporter permease [Spirochaetales bacterium]